MANPKPPSKSQELTPEQRTFQERKQQQKLQDSATESGHRSDRAGFLKTARQEKEERKIARQAARPEAKPVTRREFLNYAWGAAMGLVLAEAGITAISFALPRFKEGEFGGVFDLGQASTMPSPDDPPLQNLDGAFWLVNDDDGLRALYRVCTHLGCLYEWKDQTWRFECPCHGSKFEHNGIYIEGPAPRSLDQFAMRLEKNGQVLAESSEGGRALPLAESDAAVVVDTGKKLLGKPS